MRTHNNAHRNVNNESKFVTKNNNYYLQSLCQIPPGLWKYFIRPSINSSFHDRLESVQYNACLAITAAVRGASKEKFLESLRLRRWYRKLFLFYKYLKTNILNTFSIWFLLDVLHTQQGLCTNFPFLNQNIISSKKNFSRLLSLNGMN